MAFVCFIDEKICNYIARGNEQAFNIICTYHMDDVRRIRNCMFGLLRDKYFYDVNKLEASFYEAVVNLGIEVKDLVEPSITLVSLEPEFVKLAGL